LRALKLIYCSQAALFLSITATFGFQDGTRLDIGVNALDFFDFIESGIVALIY
jgi:hypothetical protein